MEASCSRVATLMLRRNSRKDIGALGTLFAQWSTGDPMRRMTMGGADPASDTHHPSPSPAFMDAFCAVQLTANLSKDPGFLLSPKGSINITPLSKDPVFLLSPKGSINITPTASTALDGATLLPPSVSKTGLEGILASSTSFRASAEALMTNRGTVGTAAPSPLALSS